MKQAGCYVINLGVESGHPQILKNIKKGVTLDQLEHAHKLTRKHDIRTYSTFLVGSPGETEETFRATINFAKKIRPSLANFFVAVAYPGTAMYEQAVNEGLIEPVGGPKRVLIPGLIRHSKGAGDGSPTGQFELQDLTPRPGRNGRFEHFTSVHNLYGTP